MEDISPRAGRMWRSWLLWLAIALAVISLLDAFLVDRPIAAIVYGVLVGAGAYWLSRSDRSGPAFYLCVLMLLELIAVLFIYPDEGESLDARSLVFVVVTGAGAATAFMTLIRRER